MEENSFEERHASQDLSSGKRKEEPFIHRLPSEILLCIFLISLRSSTSFLKPSDDKAAVEKHFTTTTPYNVSGVCRSWREFVVSSASLWAEFSILLNHPSPRTLDHAKSVISLHLERSRDLLMSCSIAIFGFFRVDTTHEIASYIALHQRRWRKLQLLFRREPITPSSGANFEVRSESSSGLSRFSRNDYDDAAVVNLFTGELNYLEELSINRASLFGVWDSKELGLPKPVPSLRRLSLEMPGRFDKLALWLSLVPNIEELDLSFYHSDPRWYRSDSNTLQIPTIRLYHLRRITVNHGILRGSDYNTLESSRASTFVLRCLACPSLTELSVRVPAHICVRYLHEFFLRSSPPLRTLDLYVAMGVPAFIGAEGETMVMDGIVELLVLLPTIANLVLTSRHFEGVGRLIQKLCSPTLLPCLAHVDFSISGAETSQFVELVNSRWSASERALQSVVLRSCNTHMIRTSRFPSRGLHDDHSSLPEEWVGLKACIEEGLQFEVI
ncbi:hypothetical protein SCHPADRAFT_942278 [Schizopora paradoxa]|uniref:F-box domain-containing protein n=1 Tax=Schizopora paradoxa TaxID=27342 RepID=A0A0H2RH87_9AGAM|nr:hypothetical protein SCHPADRAFT_942278 [Schizopora paradoxa]